MKNFNRLILIFLFFVLNSSAFARITVVQVGAYIFPPYFEKAAFSNEGVIVELISLLNKKQIEVQFTLYETSPKRRYQDFEQGKYDLILFESPEWGWKSYLTKIDFFGQDTVDEEVFITSMSKFKKYGKEYVESIKDKSIGLFLGYHYKFADFNSDEALLKKKYNAYVSSSHVRNIISVSKDRLDLAVVTKSFIEKYLSENPELRNKIYVSSVVDQKYLMKFGLRKQAAIGEDKIKAILKEVLESEEYKQIQKKYYLK